MNNRFLKQLISTIADENTTIAEDGLSSAEFTGYVDTGSYIFNAAISGSLYGGIPNTKKLGLCGEQAVGKTFFSLGIAKYFLNTNPDAFVLWYLAETAVTKKMLVDRGIDTNRFVFAEPVTVQDFKFHAIKTLDTYLEASEKDRPPMMMVLDSLGQLSTNKEMEDVEARKDVADVGRRAGTIKAAFRVLESRLARAHVPMIVTNHIYANVGGYGPSKEIAGGSGMKYASDCIVMLTKAKESEGEGANKEVTGNVITIAMYKNRFAKENTRVKVLLSYDKGLDRYYGLLDLAEKYEIIKKVSTRYEMPDGTKVFGKEINRNPEKYFTKDIMERLEAAARNEFEYGKGVVQETVE